jgi:hypothetical protein
METVGDLDMSVGRLEEVTLGRSGALPPDILPTMDDRYVIPPSHRKKPCNNDDLLQEGSLVWLRTPSSRAVEETDTGDSDSMRNLTILAGLLEYRATTGPNVSALKNCCPHSHILLREFHKVQSTQCCFKSAIRRS